MRSLQTLPNGITCLDWAPKEEGKTACANYLQAGRCSLASHFECSEWRKKQPVPIVSADGPKLVLVNVLATPSNLTDRGRVFAEPADDPLALDDGSNDQNDPLALSLSDPPFDGREAAGGFSLEPTEGEPLTLDRMPGLAPSSVPFAVAKPAKPQTPKAARAAARAAAAWTALTAGDHPAAFEGGEPYVPALSALDPREIERLEAMADEVHLHSETLGDIVLVKEHRGTNPGKVEMTFREAAFLRLVIDAFPGARVVQLVPPDQVAHVAPMIPVPDYRPPQIEPLPLDETLTAIQRPRAPAAAPADVDPFDMGDT